MDLILAFVVIAFIACVLIGTAFIVSLRLGGYWERWSVDILNGIYVPYWLIALWCIVVTLLVTVFLRLTNLL